MVGNGDQLSGSLAEAMASSLEKAREKGLILPYHVAAIGANGQMQYMRYDPTPEGGVGCIFLQEYEVPENILAMPINMFFVDINGNSYQTVLEMRS